MVAETSTSSNDTMGSLCAKVNRRITCRRMSLCHLRIILGGLLLILCLMVFNYVTGVRIRQRIDSQSQLAFVRTSKELDQLGESVITSQTLSHEQPNGEVQSKQNSAGKRNITKTLYIHSELQPIVTWSELDEFVSCVRVEEGKPLTKPCMVQCPSGERIEITLGADLSNARTKDAVLFGLSPFTLSWSFNKALGYRPVGGQLIVFYSMENALRMHKWNKRLGNLKYHVDMTYGAYSNVSIPYAYFTPFKKDKPEIGKKNWMEGKTKLIAWMASNCREVYWPRNEFVAELQRHMKVDTYGRCGNLTCLPRMSEECVKMVSKYKFYLSLENSECDDYLTEKIWVTGLENDVVPVVYGPRKADYAKYAPPNSFIHVSDFASAEELARYLKRVANDVKLYNSFFKWREQGRVVKMYPNLKITYFCKLLPYMEKVPESIRQVKDSGWFQSCRHPLKVYKTQNLTELQRLQGWQPW